MNSLTRIAAALGGVVLVVGLSGCSGSTSEPSANNSDVAASGAPVASAPQTPTGSAPAVAAEHNAPDVSFTQLMLEHHEGALEMSELATSRAQSADVKKIAATIEEAQRPEIVLMEGWLTAWGEPRDPAKQSGMDHDDTGDGDEAEGGMGHDGMDMGGKSQEEVMVELRKATGTDFDRQFLTDMIAHHQGAVMMAEQEQKDGQNPQAIELAGLIIDSQQTEIAQMQKQLTNL